MPLYATLDPDNTGGAMLLGVDGLCLISHGSSSATAIVNAVRVAKELHDAEIVDSLRAAVAPAESASGRRRADRDGERDAHRRDQERPPEDVRVVGLAEPRQAEAADDVGEREDVGEGRHRAAHHLTRRAAAAEQEHRDEQQVAEGVGRPAGRGERSEGETDGDEAAAARRGTSPTTPSGSSGRLHAVDGRSRGQHDGHRDRAEHDARRGRGWRRGPRRSRPTRGTGGSRRALGPVAMRTGSVMMPRAPRTTPM